MLAMKAMKGGTSPVEVFGPYGIKEYLDSVFRLSELTLSYPLDVIELNEETFIGIRDNFEIRAAPLVHRVPCFGYSIKELERPGKFLSSKALEFGVPNIRINELIQEKFITLDDGKNINYQDCLDHPFRGRHIVVLGDTCDSMSIAMIAEDCDILIHETTFDKSLKEHSIEAGHSTTEMAAEFAILVKAKKLIITHFSSRYHTHAKITVNDLFKEVEDKCNNIEIIAAEDFMEIIVPTID